MSVSLGGEEGRSGRESEGWYKSGKIACLTHIYYNRGSTVLWFLCFNNRYSDKENNSKAAQTSYGSKATQPDIPATELQHLCREYKNDLTLSKEEAQRVEEDTRQQSDDPSELWLKLRRCRITASNFCKRRHTTPVAALVKNLVYKSLSTSVPSLRWGKENEDNARKGYAKYMQENNHPNLRTIRAGFVIHHEHQGWLGCSPDDWVVDPDSEDPNGVADHTVHVRWLPVKHAHHSRVFSANWKMEKLP